MATIPWQDGYRVGDATIDRQHRYLFTLANELVNSKSKAELTNYAMALFRYVREHFDHEEDVMRETSYPAYRDHVAMHDELISKLSAISCDIRMDRLSVADLEWFMNHWLSTHIVEEDTKVAEFIRADA